VVREVVHEPDVEGKVGGGNVLEQREHVFAGGGRQEVVGVLHPLRDALERLELTEGVVLEEGSRIGVGDRCEYRQSELQQHPLRNPHAVVERVVELREGAVALVVHEDVGLAVLRRHALHEELAAHAVFLDGVVALDARGDHVAESRTSRAVERNATAGSVDRARRVGVARQLVELQRHQRLFESGNRLMIAIE